MIMMMMLLLVMMIMMYVDVHDDQVPDDDVPDDGGHDDGVHDDHGYEAHRNKQKHASACQGTGQMPQLGHQACLTRVPVPLYCYIYS